jgi:hypothetical protein
MGTDMAMATVMAMVLKWKRKLGGSFGGNLCSFHFYVRTESRDYYYRILFFSTLAVSLG